MKFIIRPLLSILSIPLLSRLYGKIQRLKRPKWLVRRVIPFFARHYKIDMDQYIGEFSDYSSLNEFFVRRIDPEKRPLKDIYDDTALVSPADGFLVGIDTVHEDATTQAKGRDYKLSTFVQENLPFKDGWHVATIYLSPQNYHRYHHTLSAEITGYSHQGGSLLPVNEWGVGLVKTLWHRNERVITQ